MNTRTARGVNTTPRHTLHEGGCAGEHGTGLSNMILLPPDATVVEMDGHDMYTVGRCTVEPLLTHLLLV